MCDVDRCVCVFDVNRHVCDVDRCVSDVWCVSVCDVDRCLCDA